MPAVFQDAGRYPFTIPFRLGGPSRYGERDEVRPSLGDGRTPTPTDIAAARRLARDVDVAAAALLIASGTAARLVTRRRSRIEGSDGRSYALSELGPPGYTASVRPRPAEGSQQSSRTRVGWRANCWWSPAPNPDAGLVW